MTLLYFTFITSSFDLYIYYQTKNQLKKMYLSFLSITAFKKKLTPIASNVDETTVNLHQSSWILIFLYKMLYTNNLSQINCIYEKKKHTNAIEYHSCTYNFFCSPFSTRLHDVRSQLCSLFYFQCIEMKKNNEFHRKESCKRIVVCINDAID